MPNSGQNDEECDATDDDSSNAAGNIIIYVKLMAIKKATLKNVALRTFRMWIVYPSLPPLPSVLLSGLRPGIGRLALLLR
jgi:hypothetical protein